MPFYEYVCKNCGKEIELLQKMGTTEPGQPCPQCGANNFTKKISANAPFKLGTSANTPCGEPKGGASCGGCCDHCH